MLGAQAEPHAHTHTHTKKSGAAAHFFFASPRAMKRTSSEVRKRCRELYGPNWWDTDAETKRSRQDAALTDLSGGTSASAPPAVGRASDIEALRRQLAGALPANVKVESIEDVADATMRECYELVKRNVGAETERKWLFHGTAKEACANIVSKGFNRSYCGKNATLYGRGVYFAKDITYSLRDTYSPPDAGGTKYILAARVAIGKTVVGTSGMLEPSNDAASTVDSVHSPSIFVVYKDYQALPDFLIKVQASSA